MINRFNKFFIFLLVVFFGFVIWKSIRSHDVWITFPLIKGVESCVISQRGKMDWLDEDDFKIEYFSHVPQSLPLIEGIVRFRQVRGGSELSDALVNSFFHNCYPENYSIWSISEPKEESILNSLFLGLKYSLQKMKKIYIVIDFEAKEMITTGQ